ncbi:MAG: c-type cytochrome, partial [Pseudomonadales bacterium]
GQKSRGKILTYKLGGAEKLPPVEPDAPIPEPPALTASVEDIAHGNVMYHRYCGVCHGPGVRGGGVIPDLRHMPAAKHLAFREIVLDGILKDRGMVGFADVLTPDDVRSIQGYVISEAHKLHKELN